MDPWKESAAWEDCRDAIRAWAELEGKSPQMADDLIQQYSPPARQPHNWAGLAVGAKLLAWAVEVWCQITRR